MPMSVSLMSVYLSVRLSLHLAKGGEPETYYNLALLIMQVMFSHGIIDKLDIW